VNFIKRKNACTQRAVWRNPNVLYELGIAQAMDKPVIMISKQSENIPIDIKSRRFIIYKDLQQLRTNLKNELIKVFSRYTSERMID